MPHPIPTELERLFEDAVEPDALLDRLVEVYGRALGADRCLLFLYREDPRMSCCTHAWQTRPEWAFSRPVGTWTPQVDDLAAQDPLYALALTDPRAIYIEDVDAADSSLVNAPYEREHFGHRALIHAPVVDDGRLLGILEPCTIAAPRSWTARDREVTEWVQVQLTPVVERYLAALDSETRATLR